jgi:hypothetical protein
MSLDAIREFAGDPVDQARYYPADSEYLVTRPSTVRHYQSSEFAASSVSYESHEVVANNKVGAQK